MKIVTLIALYALSAPLLASAETPTARSIGKFTLNQDIELKQEIANSPVVQSIPKTSHETSADNSLQLKLAYHGSMTEFEIFDAWVELTGDLDDDGFYHHIRVGFDADTDSDSETVYAKLFLSREGGPWYQYADTDLFDIHGDSADDSYEVLTELIEGYRPGYYEVLIELHSLYHPGIVASMILDREHGDHIIALEDLDHDDPYHEPYYHDSETVDISYGVGVSGSFSIAGLALLALLMVIKLRFFLFRNKKNSSVIQQL